MKSKVSIVKCANYEPEQVQESIREAVSLLGGLAAFIEPGSKILIKPNLLVAQGPECPVDTHPEVVRAVIRLAKEAGARVLVGDGPSVWGFESSEVDLVYEKSGMKVLAQEEGVELVKLDKRRWRGELLLSTWIDECDYIINVPKFKTHSYTVMTGAIKNLFGLVPDKYKLELHKRYCAPDEFARILVDIYESVRPVLNIVDGIVAMEGDGPGTKGTPRELGLVIAGWDGVAVDSVISRIMGIDPLDVPMIKEAHERKIGSSALADIEILGQPLSGLNVPPFKMPQTAMRLKHGVRSAILRIILGGIIRFKPKIEPKKCVLCPTCVKTCPNEAIMLAGKRMIIDYRKCISCFCCQESCPHKAISVKKGILASLMRL